MSMRIRAAHRPLTKFIGTIMVLFLVNWMFRAGTSLPGTGHKQEMIAIHLVLQACAGPPVWHHLGLQQARRVCCVCMCVYLNDRI